MLSVVGGDDSTVVGILWRSPASGERVGGCLQGGRLSEKAGEHAVCMVHTVCAPVALGALQVGSGLGSFNRLIYCKHYSVLCSFDREFFEHLCELPCEDGERC